MHHVLGFLLSARTNAAGLTVLALLTLTGDQGRAEDVSFSRDVMAVLSKAGCNMGACHGNAKGKGGFRLSLRGQDTAFDHAQLSGSQRIDRLRPTQSLILLKSTGRTAHQGGTRFREGSPEYQVLQQWIAAGAPGPNKNESLLKKLEVEPRYQVVVAPQEDLHLQATAIFSDGSRRDITRMATYETSNLKASVDHDGLARIIHEFGNF